MKNTMDFGRNRTKSLFVNQSVENLCLTYGKLIHVKKNTILFDENLFEKQPYVYYLVEGVCSTCGNSYQGQEQTFLYQMPGQMIGHNPYIMATDTYSILYSYRIPTVMAKTNCTLYKIPVKNFLEQMETNLEFSNYMIHLFSRNYSMVLAHLKQVQEDSAVVIICRFLLQMCMPSPEGLVVPKLFTYNEISSYIGVHMVTVSRIIGQLKQKGYIKRSPAGLVILDEKNLKDIILNTDSFKY